MPNSPPSDTVLADLRACWEQAWAALAMPAPADLLPALLQAWQEPWRHYHSLQHLHECLTLLQQDWAQASRPAEVALALFFHDAVYALQATDNEARSAAWAQQALGSAGVPPPSLQRIHALIMATCHQAQPTEADAQLLVDIDLAILGAPPARFAEYEAQIRREFAHVPSALFEPRRRQVLCGFLARSPLYQSATLHARYEAQARANLQRAVKGASATP